MRILHTSDLHIGRVLYGRKRYDEHEKFLDWLADVVVDRAAEALLIAGDVFDTATPSNRAHELYFRFLGRVAKSPCRHVVVIAGNHDSPSFLRAPSTLLAALDVHVITEPQPEHPAAEVLTLRDGAGQAELVVCAVPYLRDRDVRTVEVGESVEDKERKLRAGIRRHYEDVFAAAAEEVKAAARPVPVVAMGHVFTAGGTEGEGVRDLYVGTLAHIGADIFGDDIDYAALGHLHVPQVVGGLATRRYSGSPLPMGFGEARQQKSVCLVEVAAGAAEVELVDVPVFQRLVQIRGGWAEIEQQLAELADEGESVWVEISYNGDDVIGDLRARLDDVIANSAVEVLRVKDERVMSQALAAAHTEETLDDLDPKEVFDRLLQAAEVSIAQQVELTATYREALDSLAAADVNAE